MYSMIKFIFKLILNIFKSKKRLLIEYSLLQKEQEILLRNKPLKIKTNNTDRLILVSLNNIFKITDKIKIIKPATLLKWQQQLIKNKWTFPKILNKPGRPPVSSKIKNLVLKIKQENFLWGVKKIQGELLKLDISLDTKTIRKIINEFRRKGKLRTSLTWKKFLTIQAKSIYAMDFLTVDSLLGKRFYVHFVIHHKARKIVQFAITQNPVREFMRQQMMLLQEKVKTTIYLIRDNDILFSLNYKHYDIKEIRTAIAAPKMNSIAERFVKSVRREALDNYLIISEKQIKNILTEYINYYNNYRPHQGIEQQVPDAYLDTSCLTQAGHSNNGVNSQKNNIRSMPILGGLHHHYFRKAA